MNDHVGRDEPLTILVGNNLGRTTWVSQVPLGRLVHSASCPEELAGPTLKEEAVRSTARHILFGLVSSARAHRVEQNIAILPEFDRILSFLRVPSPRRLRPLLAHIREVVPDNAAVRAQRIFWHTRETLGFRVYLPPEYTWRMLSTHADLAAFRLALDMCDAIVRTNRYPREKFLPTADILSPNELSVWLEALACSHSFTKVAVEFYLGMSPDEEREVFLGLLDDDAPRRRRVRVI